MGCVVGVVGCRLGCKISYLLDAKRKSVQYGSYYVSLFYAISMRAGLRTAYLSHRH